jgi:hypothetical protein
VAVLFCAGVAVARGVVAGELDAEGALADPATKPRSSAGRASHEPIARATTTAATDIAICDRPKNRVISNPPVPHPLASAITQRLPLIRGLPMSLSLVRLAFG